MIKSDSRSSLARRPKSPDSLRPRAGSRRRRLQISPLSRSQAASFPTILNGPRSLEIPLFQPLNFIFREKQIRSTVYLSIQHALSLVARFSGRACVAAWGRMGNAEFFTRYTGSSLLFFMPAGSMQTRDLVGENILPPFRPRTRAAARPVFVRSILSSISNAVPSRRKFR